MIYKTSLAMKTQMKIFGQIRLNVCNSDRRTKSFCLIDTFFSFVHYCFAYFLLCNGPWRFQWSLRSILSVEGKRDSSLESSCNGNKKAQKRVEMHYPHDDLQICCFKIIFCLVISVFIPWWIGLEFINCVLVYQTWGRAMAGIRNIKIR